MLFEISTQFYTHFFIIPPHNILLTYKDEYKFIDMNKFMYYSKRHISNDIKALYPKSYEKEIERFGFTKMKY